MTVITHISFVTGVGGNDWQEMHRCRCICRRVCIRNLFARPQMDADASLRVAADADRQTLTCPSKVVYCA